MALFNNFMVWHQGLSPVDDAKTDTEHRECGTQTDQRVLQAQLGADFDAGVADSEVTEEEQDCSQDGDQEQDEDLTRSALLGLRIYVGDTRGVRR